MNLGTLQATCEHTVHIDGFCMVCGAEIDWSVPSMQFDSRARYADYQNEITDEKPVWVRKDN